MLFHSPFAPLCASRPPTSASHGVFHSSMVGSSKCSPTWHSVWQKQSELEALVKVTSRRVHAAPLTDTLSRSKSTTKRAGMLRLRDTSTMCPASCTLLTCLSAVVKSSRRLTR